MIETKHPNLSISKQCELLGIHRSGLYYKPLDESMENLHIMYLLDKQYFETPFYGARKLTELLCREGFTVNKKRVGRLMKIINWQTIYREPKTTIVNKEHKKYPYLLRDLKIIRNNQVWVTDITYIPMKQGYMYLMVIMDINSRYVLNWSVSNTMDAEWCTEVLKNTIEIYGKPEIFNTDQGSQFTSEIFTNVLKSNEIKISMDGKGRALDNIFIERLWRSVKYEDIYLKAYENGVDLYQGLTKYFTFYNNVRLHESLSYEVPQFCYRRVA